MTPGTRLAAFSVRVVRAESFRLIVAPAIADLQFERPAASRVQHVRNYVAVWRAFGGALSLDFAWNTHAWLTHAMRRMRLQLSAIGPALLLASYAACSLIFIADISTGAEQLNRSALIHNGTLRSVVTAALVLLCISGFFFILGSLSNICVARTEREDSAIRSLLEERCLHSSRH